MTHTTTHAQATLPLTSASQPSPVHAAAHSHAHSATAPEADAHPAKLSDVVAALHAHEAQDVEQQRRAEQAALQARQRFD